MRVNLWQEIIKGMLHYYQNSVTVNSLLTDTSVRRTRGAGPGRFSVSLL